jgi:uncharacterized protein (DUF58 family)
VRFSPDTRLLVCVAGLVAAAVLAVPLPAIVPSLAVLTGLLALVATSDAFWALAGSLPTLRRELPERLLVGREASLAVEVDNAGDREIALSLFDELPRDLRDADPSWAEVLLQPRSTKRLEYDLRPWVRGRRTLGPVVALVRSPLGLWRRRVMAGAGETLDVYPDTSHFLRREALHPERVLAVLGQKPARKRGEGMDFESLRDYVPGDDPRHIDWRATARRGRPVTRLYQHERNHTVIVALDTSRLMGSRTGEPPEHAAAEGGRAHERALAEWHGRTKLDHAIDAGLALVFAALAAGDRAGLFAFDRELRAHLEPRSHRADIGLFVDALQPLESRLVEADYRALTREVLARQTKRALVIVLTDFVESEPAELVQPLALLARRHQVLLVALRDRLFSQLGETGAAPGQTEGEQALYRSIVLDDLLREREETLARLNRSGLHTLDLLPEQATAGVLNRYLALRQREA